MIRHDLRNRFVDGSSDPFLDIIGEIETGIVGASCESPRKRQRLTPSQPDDTPCVGASSRPERSVQAKACPPQRIVQAKACPKQAGRPPLINTLEEEVDRPFAFLEPSSPAGTHGQLTYESRVAAYVLRHAHTLWEDDDVEQLGWRRIASVLFKTDGSRPTFQAVAQTVTTMEANLPKTGSFRRSSANVGRPPQIPSAQKARVAECMMSSKEARTFVPTRWVAGINRDDFKNQKTDEPISWSTCHRIMKTLCFDETPNDPWRFIPGLARTKLDPSKMAQRLCFGENNVEYKPDDWWSTEVVCIDPVPHILARSIRRLMEVLFQFLIFNFS